MNHPHGRGVLLPKKKNIIILLVFRYFIVTNFSMMANSSMDSLVEWEI